jgi:ribosomal protein S3
MPGKVGHWHCSRLENVKKRHSEIPNGVPNDELALPVPTTTAAPVNTLGLDGEIVAHDMLETVRERERLRDPDTRRAMRREAEAARVEGLRGIATPVTVGRLRGTGAS